MTACHIEDLTRIIIDTDPGIDDLFAILMAFGSESLEVQALLSTCGNVGIEHTTRNLLGIAALAGRTDVPVYRGAEQPLTRELVSASHVHGEDGLGGARLPETDREVSGSALEYLVGRYSAPTDTVLVTIGPMTNLAQALQAEPSIAANIPKVVAMGGGFARGNVTPHAEFNIWCDAAAADIVLSSGIPVTLIPLDATQRTVVTPDRLADIGRVPGIGGLLAQTLGEYRGSGALHDPNTVMFLESPDLYRLRRGRVLVTTSGEQIGRTVLDEGTGPHAVAFDVDPERFFGALRRNLSRLNPGS